MKAITQYEAVDGSVFDSPEQAEAHDALVRRCDSIAAVLNPSPRGSGERVKQPNADAYKRLLIGLCRELFPAESVFRLPLEQIHPMGFAGRYLDDCAPRPVNRLWFRLMCIGEDGYEYEQPFFALNPDKFVAEDSPRG